MPYITISSLATSTGSSAYITVQIAYHILKSPDPSRASFVTYWLCTLNRISDKQHLCLIPLPIFICLVSPRSSRALTLRSMCTLQISLLSRQRYQFLLRSTVIWSSYAVKCLLPHNEASIPFLIYIQISFWYYSQHPKCIRSFFSSSESKGILNFLFNLSSKYRR
jgi:hypothetical protein